MDKRKYYTLSVCDCDMCNSSADIIRNVLAKSCIYTCNDGIKEVNHAPKTEEAVNEELKVGDRVHHILSTIDMVVYNIEYSIGCRWWDDGKGMFWSEYFTREELIKQ